MSAGGLDRRREAAAGARFDYEDFACNARRTPEDAAELDRLHAVAVKKQAVVDAFDSVHHTTIRHAFDSFALIFWRAMTQLSHALTGLFQASTFACEERAARHWRNLQSRGEL